MMKSASTDSHAEVLLSTITAPPTDALLTRDCLLSGVRFTVGHARFSSRIRTYQSSQQNLVRRARIALLPQGFRHAVS